jgi:Tfp pilus assembly protein PilN
MTDTIMARLLRDVQQTTPDSTIEALLMQTEGQMDGLREDLDRLAIQVERLLKERQHIIDVLTTFYRSDISISALQPILDLARELNPALDERMK